MDVKRGEIFLVSLDPVIGSEQGRTRPALIIQNNAGNKYSPTTIVAPITSKKFSKEYLTNVFIAAKGSGLAVDSTIILNQIRTIDKRRLVRKLGWVDEKTIRKVDEAIKMSLGLMK